MFEDETMIFNAWTGKRLITVCRKDTIDFNSLNSTLVHDEYNFKDFKFPDDAVVIDIGAETGGEAMVLSGLIPNGKIYTYEPLPENFKQVKKHINLNCLKNVFPFQNAVGGSKRKEKIYYGDEKTESARAHKFIGNAFGIPQNGFVEADMITLESIFKTHKLKNVFMIKLDPEGAEEEILESASKEILEKVDWLVGEHHFNPRSKILEMLKGLFIDVPCDYQSDENIGHFRFMNKRLLNNK